MPSTSVTSSRRWERVLVILYRVLLVGCLVLAVGFAVWGVGESNGTGESGAMGELLGIVLGGFWLLMALVPGSTLWAIRARTGRSTVVAVIAAGFQIVVFSVTAVLRVAPTLFVVVIYLIPVGSLVVVLARWGAIRSERRDPSEPQSSPR